MSNISPQPTGHPRRDYPVLWGSALTHKEWGGFTGGAVSCVGGEEGGRGRESAGTVRRSQEADRDTGSRESSAWEQD